MAEQRVAIVFTKPVDMHCVSAGFGQEIGWHRDNYDRGGALGRMLRMEEPFKESTTCGIGNSQKDGTCVIVYSWGIARCMCVSSSSVWIQGLGQSSSKANTKSAQRIRLDVG